MNKDMNMNTWFVFTDGSSRGNPGSGGWAAIIIGPTREYAALKNNPSSDDLGGLSVAQVLEVAGNEDETTNNRMEISAAIGALERIPEGAIVHIFTDSKYLAQGASLWVFGWQKKGWKTSANEPVLNQDLWQLIIDKQSKRKINWHVVRGHAGHPLNERCDVIATFVAQNKDPNLYKGSLSEYPIRNAFIQSIQNSESTPDAEDASQSSKKTSKSRNNKQPYSYVSMVQGIIQTHKTWDECKARVSGVSGAKYQKVMNEEGERQLIAEWSS